MWLISGRHLKKMPVLGLTHLLDVSHLRSPHRDARESKYVTPQVASREPQGQQGKGQGARTTLEEVSLSQQLRNIVTNSDVSGRNPVTPHTCSTTQNMLPSPLHQGLQHEQLASCPTVPSEFGSVCNHAIWQASAGEGGVSLPIGIDEAVDKHHVHQGEEEMDPLADFEVDSCPDHGYPPLHVSDGLHQGLLSRSQPP